MTDTHYFEASPGASGEAYEKRSITDQKCIAETGSIIDAAFADIAKDTDTSFVLSSAPDDKKRDCAAVLDIKRKNN